jgi:hypothetical protein
VRNDAPRLAGLDYHSLAIDQRSGGRMWGQSNRTAGAFGSDADYRAALPDLEAALEWPRMQGLPARSIVWGSRYSAALVFLLAANIPQKSRPSWHSLQASTLAIHTP